MAEAVEQRRGGERVQQSPKGGRQHRAAITSELAAELGAWFQQSVVRGSGDPQSLVWPGAGGRAMARTTWRRIIDRAAKRAGLEAPTTGRPVTRPHRLRHTAVSIALSNGAGVVGAQRQIGHRDPVITARVYAHLLSDAHLDRFADAQRGDTAVRGAEPAAESAV